VKGENTVKVVGPDLTVNEPSGRDSCPAADVRGVEDLGMFPSLGQSRGPRSSGREAAGATA